MIRDSILIVQYDSLSLNTTTTNISCNGNNDGTISLNIVSGGQSPFQYSIDNGITFQSSNQFSTLGTGSYNVVIMDINSCLTSTVLNLTEPQPLSAVNTVTDISCYGDCDGKISLSISGGTATYTQSWNNANPNALCAGTYSYSITVQMDVC